MLGLYTTLSSSCLVVVPLLNWSSTLRNLGRIGLKKEPTRAIILYWGFLVALGYLSIFIQFGGEGRTTEWGLYTWSGMENITCTSQRGLNLSAGQLPSWTDLVLNQEFITENNCENPCSSSFSPNPPFRTDNDLQILTKREREFLDSWYFRIQFEDSPARNDVPHLLYFHYITFGVWSIVTVLAQGIYAISFGRRTPAEARAMLYKRLRLKLCGAKLSKSVAIFAYFWAVAVLILCPMVLIVNLVTIEIYLSNFSESDPLIHVGAWSSWAGTGLVLSAALISRYHGDAVKASKRFQIQTAHWTKGSFATLRLQRAPYGSRSIYPCGSKNLEETTSSPHSSSSLKIHRPIRYIMQHVRRTLLETLLFFKTEYQKSVAFWHDPESTSLQTFAPQPQLSTVNLLHNTQIGDYSSGTSNSQMPLSRSTTFTFFRASTTETLIELPSRVKDNESKPELDRSVIGEYNPSSSSLSSSIPPVPTIPERVLGRLGERKSSYWE